MSFAPTAKQKEAIAGILASVATWLLLFGGGRSGKTFLIVRTIVLRALKAPGSRHLIVRVRFVHLKASIIADTFPKVMRLCFPGVAWDLSKTDWCVRFGNGSEIWFGGLDEGERMEKLLGVLKERLVRELRVEPPRRTTTTTTKPPSAAPPSMLPRK